MVGTIDSRLGACEVRTQERQGQALSDVSDCDGGPDVRGCPRARHRPVALPSHLGEAKFLSVLGRQGALGLKGSFVDTHSPVII